MGALETVIQLKRQGQTDSEIINTLKNQGISPMEINDAMNQANIKQAVSQETMPESPSIMNIPTEEQYTPSPQNEYSPQPQETYSPQPYQQQNYEPAQQYPPQQYQQETYQEQPQQEYYQENYQGGGYSGNTDTMMEVAEQVFSEKIKDLSKEIKSLNEFKTIYSSRIDDMNERLKRIEQQFDKMQIAILEKVGSFGKEIEKNQKNIDMLEDSFAKTLKKL